MKLWIELDQLTHYMLVPGGVIVRYEAYSDAGNGCALTSSMVFVPCSAVDFERIYPAPNGNETRDRRREGDAIGEGDFG